MSPIRRHLGLLTATSLVIANMIGAGLFTTSGFALADLGDRRLVLLAWTVAGVLAMCGALSYGAFARRLPESGGEYAFLGRTVHPLAGFLAGWVSLWAGFTAPIAAAALGLQAYLGDSFGSSVRPEWIGTAAIVGAGLLHGVKTGTGVGLQNAAVAVKLVLIAGFVVFGVSRLPEVGQPLAAVAPSIGAFALSLVWISYAYSGWNAAVYVAGEVRDPSRNLPLSLCLATGIVMAIYLAVNAIFLYSVPPDQLAGRADVAAVAAESLGGLPLRRAVSGLVALALFTSISSMMMAGPRVYAKMADDGLFPAFVSARPETEGDAPRAAIALQAVLAVIVLWSSTLAQLLSYIGLTLGVSAAATVIALIALRRREGPQLVPIPGYPWVPAIFVVSVLTFSCLAALREPWQAGFGVLTAATGVPVYFLLRSRRLSRE